MLPGPSQPITVDIQVNGAMADHQPQALGWGEGCKGEGLLGDRDGTWGPSGDRGGSGGGSGRWGGGHTAQVHTHHMRQPIVPGPVPVLLGGPAGTRGWAQGHPGLCLQAAVGATASPPVQGDAGSAESWWRRGPAELGASSSAGAYAELGLWQPLEPKGHHIWPGTTGWGPQGLAGGCGAGRQTG